jgi:CheY-like chemotaxis protein
VTRITNKILIAEDDENTVFTYKSALERAGYEVMVTTNGLDCVNIYHEEFESLRNVKGNDSYKNFKTSKSTI